MGYQVIKQPNDLFAIFCNGTDNIIVWDANGDEIVQWFTDLAEERARRDVATAIEHAKKAVQCVSQGNAREVYYQFAMTWERALQKDRQHGGEVSAELLPTETGEPA